MKKSFKLKVALLIPIFLLGGYLILGVLSEKEDETQYLLASVERDSIFLSVSGSGQIASSDQVDIKPGVSGEIAYVGIYGGERVSSGDLLIKLDSDKTQKSLFDAKLDLIEAQTKIGDLDNSRKRAEELINEAYGDGLNSLTTVFGDFSTVIPELEVMFTEGGYERIAGDIDFYLSLVDFYDKDGVYDLSYWDGGAEEKYKEIKKQFDLIKPRYSSLTLRSSASEIEVVLAESEGFVRNLLDLARQAQNLTEIYLKVIREENLIPNLPLSRTERQFSDLSGFVSVLANRSATLLSSVRLVEDRRDSVDRIDADINSQRRIISQKEESLVDLERDLARHYIHAPIDGTTVKVNIREGDTVSSGSVLASLIADGKIAEISLNEIDAAKVGVGQKATLEVDALPDLNFTGTVIEVDPVGTVTQGVVSYGVKIVFDVDDERMRPSMSVTAEIITDARNGVLVAPNSAIKSQSGSYYVELVGDSDKFSGGDLTRTALEKEPEAREVELGLRGDLYTEISSGLKEGDVIVSSTLNTGSTAGGVTNTNRNSQIQFPGMMDGQVRMR